MTSSKPFNVTFLSDPPPPPHPKPSFTQVAPLHLRRLPLHTRGSETPPFAARAPEERIRRKVKNVDVLIIHSPTCWDPTYIHRTSRKRRFSLTHVNSRPFSDLFVFERS